MKLYMAVTADKYELPIAVEENAQILARKMGIKKCTLYQYISKNRSGRYSGVKFIAIEVDDGGGVMEICKVTQLECGRCMPGPCEHRRTLIGQAERQRILQEAIKHYGADHQADRSLEEMAELTKALLKMRRPGQADLIAVHEEIVDVQIMLDQLKIIYGWDEKIETQKLTRLQEAIQREQKG